MTIQVILPLALGREIHYAVPLDLQDHIRIGVRVEVPLKTKYYSGIVTKVLDEPMLDKLRNITAVIDASPIASERHIRFWQWLAKYYACTVGEVMAVAMPTGLKLSSETRIEVHPEYEESKQKLSTKEYLMMEALHHQSELDLNQLKGIFKVKSVQQFVKKSLEKELIIIKEELKEKYKPKLVDYINFAEAYNGQNWETALEQCIRSTKQMRAVEQLSNLLSQMEYVPKSLLQQVAQVDSTTVRALQKKEIVTIYKKQESRLKKADAAVAEYYPMSEAQQQAYNQIIQGWKTKNTALLHGITGSGKTKIYKELIRDILDDDPTAQVLYLLPEIALTTQIVGRIEEDFGNHVAYYHSRLNNHQRVELWQEVLDEKSIVLGARSSLFLPFQNLKLIIVDEEHDGSFKQQDPAPRYNARDASIVLANIFKAKVVLGSATPALESMYNAQTEKYAYVPLTKRFGKAVLPEIEIVDLMAEKDTIDLEVPISQRLREEIYACLDRHEQAIIFQNRRGYSPALRCFKAGCGWQAKCNNCDVSLTVHLKFNEMRCHYCGFRQNIPSACPSCGHKELKKVGYGTEKIEDIFKAEFPNARIARMDHDTVRSKSNYEKLLYRLENREIDILVGTQMITKGLDFDHITLVGIMDADKLFHFPDFRAGERAYQLLTQVAGRAGRRSKQGKVLLQTSNVANPILHDVIDNNFERFKARELYERRSFMYPPFNRLIGIIIKHHDRKTALDTARLMIHYLSPIKDIEVLGPSVPHVAWVRKQYIFHLLIKVPKGHIGLAELKQHILDLKANIKKMPGHSSVRINVDVDPG